MSAWTVWQCRPRSNIYIQGGLKSLHIHYSQQGRVVAQTLAQLDASTPAFPRVYTDAPGKKKKPAGNAVLQVPILKFSPRCCWPTAIQRAHLTALTWQRCFSRVLDVQSPVSSFQGCITKCVAGSLPRGSVTGPTLCSTDSIPLSVRQSGLPLVLINAWYSDSKHKRDGRPDSLERFDLIWESNQSWDWGQQILAPHLDWTPGRVAPVLQFLLR